MVTEVMPEQELAVSCFNIVCIAEVMVRDACRPPHA